ncbi:hypothetical protein [Enterococcus sp. DIV0876]
MLDQCSYLLHGDFTIARNDEPLTSDSWGKHRQKMDRWHLAH